MKIELMQLKRAALIGTALILAPSAFADTIDPVFYSDTLAVGESVTISKTVVIEESTSTSVLDVMFLMDTTGSMGGTIEGAKTAATTILADLAGFGDLASGTAYFNDDNCSGDCSADPSPITTYTAITSALSTSDAATVAGINGFTAGVPGSGFDGPEEGFLGITRTAEDTSWRAGSNRFIVMFGDNTDGYFKSLSGDTAFAGDTPAEAAAALAAEGITLIGVAINGSGAFTGAYDLTAEGSGGDVYSSTTSPTDLATTIKDAVTTSFATYDTVCLDADSAPGGVGVTTSACHTGAFDRSINRTFDFEVTFTGITEGDYVFPIHATVDGGIVATERDIIRVTDVPEPGMLSLMGIGMLGMGLGFMRRRKQQA